MSHFTLRLRVRYHECDAQNVVFNARYGDYVDMASTEFLRAAFGGYQKLVARGYENQIVKLLIEWKAPARFDDVLDLKVRVASLGSSSFTLITEIYRVEGSMLLARCEAVYVFLDAASFTKCSIPDDIRIILLETRDLGVFDQSGHPLSH